MLNVCGKLFFKIPVLDLKGFCGLDEAHPHLLGQPASKSKSIDSNVMNYIKEVYAQINLG